MSSGRDLQKRAFRDHSELSLLTEVLSWRRTLRETRVLVTAWQRTARLTGWLLLLLVLLPAVTASESPERECCENPSYNFQEAGRGVMTTPSAPAHHTYSPPEEPDMLPEVPELPGLLHTERQRDSGRRETYGGRIERRERQ